MEINRDLWLRQTAVILTFIMGFIWLIFGVLETFEAETSEAMIASILPGAVIILLGLLAVKFVVVGGVLLVVFAMVPFIMVIMGFDIPLPVLLLLTFPLMLSGGLFIVDYMLFRGHEEKESTKEKG